MIKYITILFLLTQIALIKKGEIYSIIYNNLNLLYENDQLYFSPYLNVQINNLFRIIKKNTNDNKCQFMTDMIVFHIIIYRIYIQINLLLL